ncbi:MAG TPA: sugar ABC transporter permease [Candidatus Limnocylindrales bacterium]|nr:sugar ABC transporter permease [Candidatus Limnocylindrales bacterium]
MTGHPRHRFGAEPGLWLLLLPYLIGLIALVAVPAAVTLGLAAFDYDLVRPPVFAGLDNVGRLMADDVFAITVRNSVSFVLLSVPLRLLAALGLALLLHRPTMRGGGAYRVIVLLPIVIPEVALAIAWLWVFNPLHGPLNAVLASIGLGPVAWLTDPGSTQLAMVVVSVFAIGEAFIVAIAARRAIPADLNDMAIVDGASSSRMLRHVTLPLMLPILVLLVLRDVVFALQATFVPSLVMTGGGPPPYATTYGPLFIYQQAFEFLRYGYAAAAAAFFLLLSGVLVLVQVRLLRRWRHWAWA